MKFILIIALFVSEPYWTKAQTHFNDSLYLGNNYDAVGIRIKKNNKFSKEGSRQIFSIKVFDSLTRLYPGCGGSRTSFFLGGTFYNKNKTLIFYRMSLNRFESTKTEFQKTLIDYDLTFIYNKNLKSLMIYDHLKKNFYTKSEFISWLSN